MFKKSEIAIKIRKTKWLYAAYLSVISSFDFRSYKELQNFVFFLGYPRSGSSTLGSMLDAHKNIILSHELNVLYYVEKGFSKKQIFYLIKKNSRLFSDAGRLSSGYPGTISNQHNAKAFPLRIIGDKKAGGTSLLLEHKPELIAELKQCIEIPLKCIHIIRNPFDMITTQAYGGNEKRKEISPEDIKSATKLCFQKFDTINNLMLSQKLDIYTIKHELLLKEPIKELSNLFTWLSLKAPEDYLNACAKHLYTAPHKSREKYVWSKEEKNDVYRKIDEVGFLKGYNFEN